MGWEMNKRSLALVSNAFVLSMLTMVLVMVSIITCNRLLLEFGMVSFAFTAFSMLLAFLIEESDEPVSTFVLGVSFALLIPFGIVVFVITFINSVIGGIIKKYFKGGD